MIFPSGSSGDDSAQNSSWSSCLGRDISRIRGEHFGGRRCEPAMIIRGARSPLTRWLGRGDSLPYCQAAWSRVIRPVRPEDKWQVTCLANIGGLTYIASRAALVSEAEKVSSSKATLDARQPITHHETDV